MASKPKIIKNKSTNLYDFQDPSTKHPDYDGRLIEWTRMRDCMNGEDAVKRKLETYLPRPKGMSGVYADAYDAYIERAHFPLICPYALSGVLGVVITKLPEFNLPPQLEYLHETATKDGRGLKQLFIDIMVDSFQTGRVPLAVEATEKNEFRIVQYKAESLTNWKSSTTTLEKNLSLAVLQEAESDLNDVFGHDSKDSYRVLYMEGDVYNVKYFVENTEDSTKARTPKFMGATLDEIPLVVAGSINNSIDIQPIPLIPVANCSIQIYRKEADLANSEFLSCNPTLVITGAQSDGNLPNVVGSSVMIVLPNEQSRVFYTTTDTAALTHVKDHISDLYEEAIRHGVAILDSRKGVEAAEALRIRQATQSASVYSIYLSAMNALLECIQIMVKWASLDKSLVTADAPSSLSFGIPDSNVLEKLMEGFRSSGVIPLPVIHRYLVTSGLLEATIGYEDYVKLLEENQKLKKSLGLLEPEPVVNNVPKDESTSKVKTTPKVSETTLEEVSGPEDKQ